MKYSKTVTDYCNSYRITPQDVFFAILVTNGCARPEAYGCVFNCAGLQEGTLKNRASSLVREKPGLAKLIADLINEKTVPPVSSPDWQTYNAQISRKDPAYKGGKKDKGDEEFSGWDDEQTASENIQRIIKGELPRIQGKDKADLALKYAKLIGVDPEKTDLVHYYLPLTCCQCELYKQKLK